MSYTITPRTLKFKQPAGTSRGVYTERKVWYITLSTPDDPGGGGVGECAPLPRLSQDDLPEYAKTLDAICHHFDSMEGIPFAERLQRMTEMLRPYPSMAFGLETAVLNWQRRSPQLFDTPFARGEVGIPINGLVWMGNKEEMMRRMEEKLRLGFRCIKFKIGAIDFDSEMEMIEEVRRLFSRDEVEIRVDANGAFSPDEAMGKLERLATLDIHSIEQPIRQHQWSAMSSLAAQSPIPIALDEELIGVNSVQMKGQLLDIIRPQFIVLKPSLHGGMAGTREWVALAHERGIGSWITSALESNVGLNAIAQLCAHIYGENISFPQGLGTGQLFEENIEMPLTLEGSVMWAR